MLGHIKSRWWYPFLAVQAVGLFHLLYPLSLHYRRTVARFAILPLLPGGPIALVLDWFLHERHWMLRDVPKLKALDILFISCVTLVINCGLFALAILVVRWIVRVRRNSWRKNAYTFD